MKFNYLKYSAAFSIPIIVFFSLYLGQWYSFMAIIYAFGLIPFLELFTIGSIKNMDSVQEMIAKEDKVYDMILYILAVAQVFILGYFLLRISSGNLALYERIGMISAYGVACGLSINNAHELGHRSTKFEQVLSKLLLLTSLYMHFFIEHNRGHHKNVATEKDPASSRYGESLYVFFFRTIIGSWVSAWQLEKRRLVKAKKRVLSLQNEMLRFQIIQMMLISVIGLFFGIAVMLYFILGAIIGFIQLETVNYIEHYGLRRKIKGNSYERTLPVHSWNSNHPIGRLILLELSRHSDHHFMPSRKYQTLRHFEESPQMPTGYPGMMMLALIPPLWFNVMHKRIDKYKKATQGEHLA